MARPRAARKGRKAPVRKTALKTVAQPPSAAPLPHSTGWRALKSSAAMLGGMSRCTGLVVDSQQQTQWCWAAVSNSVSHYYDAGSPWTQCAIVNAELGQTTCCTAGNTASCNQAWYLDLALTRVGRLQSMTSGTLPTKTLVFTDPNIEWTQAAIALSGTVPSVSDLVRLFINHVAAADAPARRV